MSYDNLTPVKPFSLAPADVLKDAEESTREQERYRQRLLEDAVKAERERDLLQKTVYSIANPSPIIVTTIVVAVIAALYVIYVLFLKPCMSGEWVDPKGNIWYIEHNRFSGNFDVFMNGVYVGAGKVIDNYFRFGDLIGVWNYHNMIIFTEGWGIERLL
jgi:hypothetical protein